MMYNQKLVASLKANGKILREFKDTVYCPFGAEYSILLKNLNTVRALVHVYIDGEDMIPDGLVLNAYQEIDLERSIKNGNLNEGNRFKFIERTGNIEQHRGIKLEDGLIRIEYQFEMPRPVINITDKYSGWLQCSGSDNYRSSLDASYSTNISASTNSILRSQGMASATSATASPQSETGITVPGSKSNQKFQTTYMNALDPQKYSIVLKILGETPDNEPIRKPITTKHKPKCVTCGKQNKASAKFCSECGTALEIFA